MKTLLNILAKLKTVDIYSGQIDKYKHDANGGLFLTPLTYAPAVVIGGKLSILIALLVCLAVSILVEYGDKKAGGKFSIYDIIATMKVPFIVFAILTVYNFRLYGWIFG